METKEQLVGAVKNWIQLDNDIRELAKLSKEKRDKKKALSEELMKVMKTNEIEVLDIKDGQLCYKKSKAKKPLNKDGLLKILQEYFKHDGKGIERSDEITQYILENRETVDKESITRKINK